MQSIKPLLSPKESHQLVAAFVVARLALLALFMHLTGGQEIASDVLYHKMIIDDPLGILAGTAKDIASYPPFQWVVEWPLFNLFAIYFSEMASIRLLMLTVELLAFMILIYNCQHFFTSKRMAITTAVLFIISPHQYFATLFFVQEDIISQLFMLTALLLIVCNKRILSLVVLILGVLIAKIFFIIPLFYVIFFHGRIHLSKRVLHGCLSIAPIMIVYFITISNAITYGGSVPIRDFAPNAAYAANFWVLIVNAYPEELTSVKNISVLFSAAVQLVLITFFFYLYRSQKSKMDEVAILSIPLAFFFATFYQHMPEYFLMLWPLTALLCTTIVQQLCVVAVYSFAWVPRITHGLQTIKDNFGTSAEARTEIIGSFLDLTAFDPHQLNQIALVTQTVIYTILLAYLCRLAWNRHQIRP